MRPRIEGLNVDAMEWKALGPAGLYSKLLSRDAETGARTALQRLVPEEAYAPPTIAHFHTTYEEILGVHGLFSFDSRTWIQPGSYVFHPPRTVHGFKSAVPQESWFLSRVGRDLDVNLVHEPAETDLYVIEGDVPPRTPVAMGDPANALSWTRRAFLGGGAVDWCALSVCPDQGEGSALVRLPAGWRSAPATLPCYLEMFVLDGTFALQGQLAETPAPRHSYFFYPPEEPIGALFAEGPATLYVNFGGVLPE